MVALGYFYPFWVIELHILPFNQDDPRTIEFLKVWSMMLNFPNLVASVFFLQWALSCRVHGLINRIASFSRKRLARPQAENNNLLFLLSRFEEPKSLIELSLYNWCNLNKTWHLLCSNYRNSKFDYLSEANAVICVSLAEYDFNEGKNCDQLQSHLS